MYDTYTFHLYFQVKTYPNVFTSEKPVYIKLSGDGAKFSQSSNYILLSFSFPSCDTDVLAGSGKSNNDMMTPQNSRKHDKNRY